MERRTLLTAAFGAATAAATTACSGGSSGNAGKAPGGTSGSGASGASTSGGADVAGATGLSSKGSASTAAWNALAKGLDGDLVRPDDAAYATARQLYNTRFDSLKPAGVAYVSGEDDIKECLAFARTHHTPVSIRNGGHSYAGWSSGNGRLVIDISKLASLKRAASDGTVGSRREAGRCLPDPRGRGPYDPRRVLPHRRCLRTHARRRPRRRGPRVRPHLRQPHLGDRHHGRRQASDRRRRTEQGSVLGAARRR